MKEENKVILTPRSDYDLAQIPDKYSLNQNYPNPLNPRTTISFAVLVQSEIRIAIYDVLGNKVITLVDKIYPSGEYQVQWNGRNQSTMNVVSGIYFYRMVATGIENLRNGF